MTLTGNGKFVRPVVPNATARQAFARLDKILAKSTLSDIEKIDRLRRAVFGVLPEDGHQRRGRIARRHFQTAQARPIKP